MPQPVVVGLGGSLNPRSTSEAALAAALAAARMRGADTDLLSLRDLRLPFYEPDWPLSAYPMGVMRLLCAMRRADVVLISTPGDQGTLAGITKNALDFLAFLHDTDPPYLGDKFVGLIATANSETTAHNALHALVNIVQARNGLLLPLRVPIPYADKVIDVDGRVVDVHVARRLAELGTLAVEYATHGQIAV